MVRLIPDVDIYEIFTFEPLNALLRGISRIVKEFAIDMNSETCNCFTFILTAS